MNMMHTISSSAISVSLVLFSASFSGAGDNPVTPYGDHCKDCTIYGVCKEPIPPQEALHSLRKYYEERGYRLGMTFHKGRFIEAEIFHAGRLVDKVIFDRKTGRVRSIY